MTFTDHPDETVSEALDTINWIEEQQEYVDLFIVGEFGLESGSHIAQDPARYGVRRIWYAEGDDLRLYALYQHKDGRRTARALFVQITALGYRGGYSAVTDFIRAWRSDSGKATKAFVPLVFENGEAFQFDWSEEGMIVGGVFHKVQAAHLKLCESRAFWLVAYPTQSHEMLFDAHTRSFAALGGVPHRGIYDNMKTAVDEVLKGKGRVVNARFKAMCSHYLFDPDFCNVASGWEKGRVEKNVQDSRRRIWIEAR
jgi:transposase